MGCTLYRVQGSGMHYIKSAWFWDALCTECRILECIMHRFQVHECGTHSAKFRRVLCTKYNVLKCIMVQGFGVSYAQSAGYWNELCTECKVLECVMYILWGSGER